MTRLYHIIVVNDRTGAKVYMTATPCTHAEACTILSKIPRRPKLPTRALLEEA